MLAIKHHIEGRFKLPSSEEMRKEYQKDIEHSKNHSADYLFKPSPIEGFKLIDDIYSHIVDQDEIYKGKNETLYSVIKKIMK